MLQSFGDFLTKKAITKTIQKAILKIDPIAPKGEFEIRFIRRQVPNQPAPRFHGGAGCGRDRVPSDGPRLSAAQREAREARQALRSLPANVRAASAGAGTYGYGAPRTVRAGMQSAAGCEDSAPACVAGDAAIQAGAGGEAELRRKIAELRSQRDRYAKLLKMRAAAPPLAPSWPRAAI